MSKIEVYSDKLIVNCFFYKLSFKKSEITMINPTPMWFFMGKAVRIYHTRPYGFSYIVFWSYNRKKLLTKLKEAGYLIGPKKGLLDG